MPLSLKAEPNRPLTILCLGAHCDDIEIGCGASLLTLLITNPGTRVHWEVFCSNETRKQEAEAGAKAICAAATNLDVKVHGFRDGFLPYLGIDVKERFEELKKEVQPNLIFTHYGNDKHQDHRQVSELTWSTFRNHTILEYEIPKWDGDLGQPNVYVPISKRIAEQKVEIIREVYRSQSQKQWFTEDVFNATLRLRGVESNSTSGFAEAFYGRKLCLG